MGRPWWHDSYWEKNEKRQRPRWPNRKTWVWLALVILSLVLAMTNTSFQPTLLTWVLGFVSYFCRILSFTIFLRVMLSWFRIGYYSWPVIILNELTDPLLLPIRRVIPSFGGFDFSPLAAIMALYFIPSLFRWLILLFI